MSAFAATCRGCGKGFRVPQREKDFACKACGGVVRAEDDPELEAHFRPQVSAQERRETTKQIQEAVKAVEMVRNLFGAFACFCGLSFVLWLFGIPDPDKTGGFPRLLSRKVSRTGAESAEVWFQTEAETFRTGWSVNAADGWDLRLLDPPK